MSEPECFYPTEEEFSEPIKYIEKLRKTADKFGICKIVPPASFRPPFVPDTETLRFAPKAKAPLPSPPESSGDPSAREEAQGARATAYVEALRRFHLERDPDAGIKAEIQEKDVDLYALRRAVERKGGPDQVSEQKQWAEIGRELGFDSRMPGSLAISVRILYFKYIRPFEKTAASLDLAGSPEPVEQEVVEASVIVEQALEAQEPEGLSVAALEVPGGSRDSDALSSKAGDAESVQGSISDEQAAQTPDEISGAGLTDADVEAPDTSENVSARDQDGSGDETDDRRSTRQQRQRRVPKRLAEPDEEAKPRKKSRLVEAPPEDHCIICASAKDPSKLLICDGCEKVYHLYCLTPPLAKVPRGKWFCPDCHRAKYPTPAYERSAFGMTLDEFREDVDKHEASVLESDVSHLGAEFWRLVEDGDYLSSISQRFFYGLDMPIPGASAFPTIERNPWEPYTSCTWNLNNLAIAPASLFSCLSRDIPTFVDPRVSFGFCFNSQPWKLEEYFAPTISYMHTGRPRTWYCVPSTAIPELVEFCKTSLGHNAANSSGTLPWIDPVSLRDNGIPFYEIDQQPGELVLLFAKSATCYFDHGFNSVETVSIGIPSWLPSAFEFQTLCSVDAAKPPFPLEDLIVNAAQESSTDFDRCVTLLEVMQKVEEREKTHLNTLRTLFPTMVLAPASMDSEEDVVCSVCQQFCFFSYLSCPCDEAPIRCLAHYDGVCNGSEQHDPVLYNRSPLSKLRYLIDRVNKVASKPAEWLSRARALLRDNQGPQLRALQQLYEAAEKLPSIPVQAESLHEYLVVAEAWLDRATKVLDAGKRRLKKLAMDIDEDHRSTISEVQSLLAEADTVGLETPEIKALGSILDHALDYQERARGVLALSLEGDEARKNANDLLDLGATLEVHVEEFDILEKRLAELEWWQNASLLVDKTFVEYDDVCDMAEDGRDIGIKSDEPLFARLRKMRSAGDQWRIDALRVVKSKSISMDELRGLDARTEKTPSIKELREKIRQLISKVDDWRNRARSLLAAANVELPPMDEEVIIKKKSRSKGFSRADSEPDDDEGDQMSPKTGAEGDVKEATWLKKTDEAGTLPAPSESPDASVTPTKRVLLAGETRSLVSELDNCPVKPVEIAVFKEELRQVEDWVSRAKKVFARRDKTLKESLDEIQTNLVNGVGSGEGLFCLCRTADEGFMIECDICHEWYHGKCVRITQKDAKKHHSYVCPVCDVHLPLQREKRPHYQEILRLAEGIRDLSVVPDEKPTVDTIVALVEAWEARLKAFLAKEDSEMKADDGKVLKDMLRVCEGMKLDFSELSDVLRRKVVTLVPIPDEDAGKVFCTCKRPYDPVTDVDMMECDKCKDWFHFGCVNLTTERAAEIVANEEIWLCLTCKARAAAKMGPPLPPHFGYHHQAGPVVPGAGYPFWGRPAQGNVPFTMPGAPRSPAKMFNRQGPPFVDVVQARRDEGPKLHGPVTEIMALYLHFSKHPVAGVTLETITPNDTTIPDHPEPQDAPDVASLPDGGDSGQQKVTDLPAADDGGAKQEVDAM